MAKEDDLRGLIEACVELKKMPHLFRKAQAFWGYPEFFEFVDSVLMIEADESRGYSRQGLPVGAYAELEMLRAAFLEQPSKVAARDLMPKQREQLEKVLLLEAERIKFTQRRY